MNKNGTETATDKELFYIEGVDYEHGDTITDYKHAASLLGYDTIVGEFYITRQDGRCFE